MLGPLRRGQAHDPQADSSRTRRPVAGRLCELPVPERYRRRLLLWPAGHRVPLLRLPVVRLRRLRLWGLRLPLPVGLQPPPPLRLSIWLWWLLPAPPQGGTTRAPPRSE